MNMYYFEICDSETIVGKTSPFLAEDMNSSWVNEEKKYLAEKIKKPRNLVVHLKKVQ